MNNKIKLIVTDDASEFTQENLNILQSKRIFPLFSVQKTEKNCAIKLKEKALMLY